MKFSKRFLQSLACCFVVAMLTSTSFGAIQFRVENTTSNSPGPVSVNIFLDWDGGGGGSGNLLSQIHVQLDSPTAALTFEPNATPSNPLGFQFPTFNVAPTGEAFINFDNVLTGNIALGNGPNLLTTMTVNTTTFGDFQLGLTLLEAFRGQFGAGGDLAASGEVTVTGGLISVVPEPSSLLTLGFAAVAACCYRRRR